MDKPIFRVTDIERLTQCSEKDRFIIELEFMQCLSNPHYLNFLAQNKYLEDPAFKKYLKYLEYWKQPQYAKYLVYPHCLFFLEQLQDEAFCKAMQQFPVADFIHTQQFRFWQHYWNDRVREDLDKQQPDTGASS